MSSTTNKYPVIFEDDDVLIIDKPTGVVVNISETSPENTIQNFLNEYLKIDLNADSEYVKRSGVVHRLDKDTSGLLAIAKNENAFFALKEQFKTRSVSKEYIAVVYGLLEEKLITVKAPLGRDPKNRLRMAVIKDGRFALTNFETVGNYKSGELDMTVVIAKPLTGRTHQIRVHLSALSHPIMGDPVYIGKKRYLATFDIFKRMMLHAWKLSFDHPVTKERISLESPLPEEFRRVYSK